MTLVALLSMTAVMAQNENGERRAPRQMTPEDMTTRMTQQLSLTADQQTKVLALNKEYQDMFQRPGMGRGFGGGRPGGQGGERPQMTDEQRQQFQKQMQEMQQKRQEYEKKLNVILTDDQYKTYEQSRQRRGGFGGPGGQRGPRGQRPQQ